jgi:hypothetical protein
MNIMCGYVVKGKLETAISGPTGVRRVDLKGANLESVGKVN